MSTTPHMPHPATALCWWQNPECTGINRLPQGSSRGVFRSAADALAGRNAQTRSLDGLWRFALAERPEATPVDFAEPRFDDSRWNDLAVPALWTMNGYDRPHYTNWELPIPADEPQVPASNPTGLYRTTFSIPKAWLKRRVVLEFAGVEAGCYGVWVNGRAVGLGKDSRLPSAFDISEHLVVGDNTLAVQCIKWSDSTYIEDQDHWRQYGISRSVTLTATDPAYIQDLFCHGSFDHRDGSGVFHAELTLGGAGDQGWSYRVHLQDPQGKPVKLSQNEAEIPWGCKGHTHHREPTGVLDVPLKRVQPWNHEAPALYTVVAELIDPKGRVVEATRTRIGFRTITIENKELRLNGTMVYIKGVNRHDHHDRTGKIIDRATIEADLRVMQAHHINAIRCSHYPNDPLFYELCDEYGFLVVDEANIESHHTYAKTCHNPRYAQAFLDRGMRMVLRDRNHPCIIAWSTGNESGFGPNQDAMIGWMRHADPTRIIHCEGAICMANSHWNANRHATDLVCPMYPQIADMVRWAQESDDPRPFIACEYSHAMGNSNGSLADYWAAFETVHGLQGGFIWEWIDHGLVKTTDDGEEYWAYGGDFGETPHAADFVCDGLVWPDRTPHPAMAEVKRIFQPLAVTVLDPAGFSIEIRSKYNFITSAHLRGSWALTVDGVTVDSGPLPKLALAPGESQTVTLKPKLPLLSTGQEARLVCTFADSRDLPLVGRDMLAVTTSLDLDLPASVPAPQLALGSRGLQAVTGGVDGDGLRIRWDEHGLLTTYEVDGRQLIQSGPGITGWRAPLQNDGIRDWHFHRRYEEFENLPIWHRRALVRWMCWGMDEAQTDAEPARVRTTKDGRVVVEARRRMWGHRMPKHPVVERLQMTVCHDGSLDLRHRYQLPSAIADLGRLGAVFSAGPGLDQLEFYGHGPEESYNDRCLGTPVGRYASSVRDRYVPYIMPQEHGNIHGLRWLALRDTDGHGLLVSCATPVDGKATQVSDATLTAARHTYDVAFDDHTTIHLDVRQRGLGTKSCGPDTLERYLLHAGTWNLGYRLLPLRPGADPGLVHRSR